MPDDKDEEWKKVCEQAAKELDPNKLIQLTRRITELLDERRLNAHRRSNSNQDTGSPPASIAESG